MAGRLGCKGAGKQGWGLGPWRYCRARGKYVGLGIIVNERGQANDYEYNDCEESTASVTAPP